MDIQYLHIYVTVILVLYVLFSRPICNCNKEHMSGSTINDEALQNLASIYNTGKLVVDNLEVKGTIDADGPIRSKEYVLAGDGSKDHTFITAEGIDSKNNNSGKILKINHRGNGNVDIFGLTTVNNNLKSNNIESYDFIKGKRLDIINKDNSTTHLNHNNTGVNYIRGNITRFKNDVRLEKYDSMIINNVKGCNKPADWRLHWGCNAVHAFS